MRGRGMRSDRRFDSHLRIGGTGAVPGGKTPVASEFLRNSVGRAEAIACADLPVPPGEQRGGNRFGLPQAGNRSHSRRRPVSGGHQRFAADAPAGCHGFRAAQQGAGGSCCAGEGSGCFAALRRELVAVAGAASAPDLKANDRRIACGVASASAGSGRWVRQNRGRRSDGACAVRGADRPVGRFAERRSEARQARTVSICSSDTVALLTTSPA